jgi:putative lipoic acid-binding regulatory protein
MEMSGVISYVITVCISLFIGVGGGYYWGFSTAPKVVNQYQTINTDQKLATHQTTEQKSYQVVVNIDVENGEQLKRMFINLDSVTNVTVTLVTNTNYSNTTTNTIK